MTIHTGKLLLACVSLSAVLVLGACTSTSSTRAKSLKMASAPASSVSDCKNLTVLPFGIPSGKKKLDASLGVNFAQSIETRLSNDYGPLFDSVEYGSAARGVENECVLKGAITKYKPGSRVARAVLIGLGAASLEGNVTLEDAKSGTALLNAPFDKLWAWGGIIGASKGMDDMVSETTASVASTVAHAKGWTESAPK